MTLLSLPSLLRRRRLGRRWRFLVIIVVGLGGGACVRQACSDTVGLGAEALFSRHHLQLEQKEDQ